MTSVKAWPLLLLQFSLVSMEKGCPFPDLNGKIILSAESRQKNNFPDNSQAVVECIRGHEREEGSDVIICRSGKWSDPELKCKKIDCGLPEDLPHMNYSITEGTLFGARIKPICERGYDLEGSSYWQCLVSGWSGKSKCSSPTTAITTTNEATTTATATDTTTATATDTTTATATDTTTATATDTTTATADTTTATADTTTATADTTTATADTTTATADTTTATADTTTATADTTTATADTLSIERILYEPLTPSPSESSFKSNDTTTFVKQKSKDVVALTIGAFLFTTVIAICFALRYNKQRGSYNTGEELKTKEELMVYQSL
ncbi:probable maltase-glucoamylase 2 isoform X3 [Chanodichthys erythropterus]|uniref:probable maltase-glucoamylase 2 isoform X3 n=1 Tax=Chanodichthys erythropterus TaxID=933992 RepID=UPI00351DED88